MENCFGVLAYLPLHVSVQNALWRRLQVLTRSQWFFNGRLACSGCDWPSLARRSRERACADGLAWMHDSSDLCLSCCASMLALADLPWSQPWQQALSNCREACLDGLVEIGRQKVAQDSVAC